MVDSFLLKRCLSNRKIVANNVAYSYLTTSILSSLYNSVSIREIGVYDFLDILNAMSHDFKK